MSGQLFSSGRAWLTKAPANQAPIEPVFFHTHTNTHLVFCFIFQRPATTFQQDLCPPFCVFPVILLTCHANAYRIAFGPHTPGWRALEHLKATGEIKACVVFVLRSIFGAILCSFGGGEEGHEVGS